MSSAAVGVCDAEERRHFELFAPDGKLDKQHRLITDLIVYQSQRNTTRVEPAQTHKVIEGDFDFAPSKYEVFLPQCFVLQFFRNVKAKKDAPIMMYRTVKVSSESGDCHRFNTEGKQELQSAQ